MALPAKAIRAFFNLLCCATVALFPDFDEENKTVRLSWNEIRARAATFAHEWEGQGYEKGQTQLFYRDFFDVFGVPVRRVASFEEPVRKLGDKRGFIDLFWKGVLLVEQKSVGRSLAKAKQQALDYFPGLKDPELPRYLLLSDFQSFELYDLDEGESFEFSLLELAANVEKLGFILGVQRRSFKDQDPVNIEASELVGRLHDALEESGYVGHDLEQFLVRVVFCLFADDTGIFEPRDIFLDLLENRTRDDGSDVGGWLAQLFQTLDTPEDKRAANLDEDLARFPYVNGDLFRGPIRIPSFDSDMRERLVDACGFDWSVISPAIFGALFQSVMDPAERRAMGAHYTTEKNILRLIQPLFLDDLWVEFRRLQRRKDSRRRVELRRFHERLGQLRFLDPACGCGNFLIIAYRELRLLEIEVIKEHRKYQDDVKTMEMAADLSLINVDQFYGIEISEFPARIAETALWMMDHIMNVRLTLEFGKLYVRIPLRNSPHVLNADALEVDWAQHLDPEQCSYVMGNPPFSGSKYQSDLQRSQVRRIAGLGGSGGTLDLVTAWFLRAGAYIREGGDAKIGFVATNSICQGEQVAQLWPLIFGRYKLEISYAHRTFAWGSDARGKAHVHVIILGLTAAESSPASRKLFSYDDIDGEPTVSIHTAISPYLFDASRLTNSHLVIREIANPMNGLPKLSSGTQPIDDGNYIFDVEEREAFLDEEPGAERFLRPYIGSREFINGGERWILALQQATAPELRRLPKVVERMRRVREFRASSKRKSTLAIADFPQKFNVEVIPTSPFLVIPEVSSERREYIPIAWLTPPTVPSNKVRILKDAAHWQFGLLTSAMHMAWVRHISGRLKSDFQYGIGITYNTFPLPQMDDADRHRVSSMAQAVLDARAHHVGASLADLYDPDTMPTDLRTAHRALDRAVDRLYSKGGFSSDRERAEHLFGLYERLAAPVVSVARSARRGRKKKSSTNQ